MSKTTHGVRIDNVEKRTDKHEELIEKMGAAQTDMMVSLAKLHGSVRILIIIIAASFGVDVGSLMM
tara:strand:+ start:9633 stop:9830 length:198 start_codon:yes stop_codon:yes gene_type:complete